MLLIVGAGVSATVLAFMLLWFAEIRKTEAELQMRIENRIRTLELGLQHYEDMVFALQGYLIGAGGVGNRRAFEKIAGDLMAHHGGVQALLWAPRVTAEERAAYERSDRVATPRGLRITERSGSGGMRSASARAEYFPVSALAQSGGHLGSLGYDLASEPERRYALEQSRDTGLPVATRSIRLLQDSTDEPGIILFMPVFRAGTSAATITERRAELIGFAVGVFRAVEMIDNALTSSTVALGLNHYFFDGAVAADTQILYARPSRLRNPGEQMPPLETIPAQGRAEHLISFGTRQWAVITVPVPGIYPETPGTDAWLVLVVGFLLTGLAAQYLRVSTSRARELEKLTEGLSATADSLSQEITRRKHVEADLRSNATRLERFQRLTIGREKDMIGLKQEVNALLRELARPEKYQSRERAGATALAPPPQPGNSEDARWA